MYSIYPNKDPYYIEVTVDNQLDGDWLGPFFTFIREYCHLTHETVMTVEATYNYKIRHPNYRIQFISIDTFSFYVYYDTPLIRDEVTKNVNEVIRILNRRIRQREIQEIEEWRKKSR